MLRSYCLDLWELFFEEQKTKVCDVLNISECVLSSENYNMLAIKNTQTGKRLFEDGFMYMVSSVKNKELIAFSSPHTGFATIPNNEYDICINNRHYLHQDHILDLNERSPYFKFLFTTIPVVLVVFLMSLLIIFTDNLPMMISMGKIVKGETYSNSIHNSATI